MTYRGPTGWFPDPTQRYSMRYFDGEKWTDHASNEPGKSVIDQLDPPPALATPAQGPSAESGQSTELQTENFVGSASSHPEGWWQASDGNWYPPQQAEVAATTPAQAEMTPPPDTPKSPWAKFRSWPRGWQIACWALLAFIVTGVMGTIAGTDPDETASTDSATTTEKPETTATEPPPSTAAPTTVAPTTTAPAPTTAPPPTQPPETVSQQNARESAANYLGFAAFSRSGLIDQLMFEGFSEADATYGVDAQNADWNEQAALSAANYLDFGSFSRSSLIDQLVFEGFSQAEAEYGVSTTGL